MGELAAMLYVLGVCQEFVACRSSMIDEAEVYAEKALDGTLTKQDQEELSAGEREIYQPSLNYVIASVMGVVWPLLILYVMVTLLVEAVLGDRGEE